MNVIEIIDHPHFRHIAMATCLCVAVTTFFASMVAMVVMVRSSLPQTSGYSSVMNRLRFALTLAAVTGLFGSVPFAWATCSRTVVSFLVWDLAYAAVIALITLFCAVLVAGIAIGLVESGDFEMPYKTGMFGRGTLFRINPASGLPMNGALDIAGNCYGWDSHSRLHHRLDL